MSASAAYRARVPTATPFAGLVAVTWIIVAAGEFLRA